MKGKEMSHHLLIFLPKKEAKMAKRESKFQRDLVKELKAEYPGSYVFKINGKQGYPDLIFLYEDKWATLECKKSAKAKHRPNQDEHVERMNNMSFSSFIYPENKQEVLHELSIFMGKYQSNVYPWKPRDIRSEHIFQVVEQDA